MTNDWIKRMKWLLAGALLVPFAAAAEDAGKPLEKVRLMLHWKHQPQFAGFYMAKEKGFYEQRGFDVQIDSRPARSEPLDLLVEGRVDFATHFLAAGIGLRGVQKDPIVHIGQFFNRSNMMLVARRSDGVEKLSDLSGKTVAWWEGYYRFLFRALFQKYGVVDVIERPLGPTIAPFTSRQIAAASAMEYNEYFLTRAAMGDAAGDLVAFPLRELGLDFPEDALYTTEMIAAQKPELCRAILAATLEGWEYALEHPEETLAVVARIANTPGDPASEEHSRWMLRICSESITPLEGSGRTAGRLSRSDFNMVKNFLLANGEIRHDFTYDEFVRLDAVEPPSEQQ